ncbi:MAG TPA: phosphoglycolate phosphatase [Gammaproteobacteria bacterium]|nr:phosphoglycolate phosphatase [Gammaproteobacteria bacterium]
MFSPKLVLIDLDGTLVDSVPDLAFAADAMMRELALPEPGEEAVRHWVGNGVERLVKRVLTGELHAEPDAALFEKAYPIYYAHYLAANGRYSRLYPGVKQGLALLKQKNLAIGCVTNKAESFTLPLLEAKGIRDYFGIVVSGDTLPQKKPDPAPLLHAAKHFGVSAEQSLMLGDSQHDVKAARNAGFRVVAVSYGYNHGQDIREANPDAVIDSFVALESLLI